MKSYTDIEQSRKLAEILPIKSADLWYAERYAGQVLDNGEYVVEDTPTYGLSLTRPSKDNYSQDTIKDVPCWSLAALLNVLPSVITRQGKRMFLTLEKADAYNLYYKSPNRLDELWATKEDVIDAFVEMIITLKDMNLL